ncbi:MADS-box transcription factor [Quillaja saponaria]|uniref:MADS-box transcription factor n=1 Tax=Quillaja saponaria TaxID=32244 RepID=A0AAD7L4Y5_QUISA|nr:MADS-box transcription factor [Quillaja saponaria]
MSRVKFQIKKIENTTNRHATFSKRRNGLLKKVYELSVLCDVDVALIMFSPSGKASLFSWNKSIEQILAQYVKLSKHEHESLKNSDSQLEEIQQEILSYKTMLEDAMKLLSIFEGDPSEITTLSEVEYREHILEETLKKVWMRKQILEEQSNSQATPQVQLTGLDIGISNNSLECCLPAQRDPRADQILDFLDANYILLPHSRDQQQPVFDILSPPSSTFVHGQNINQDDLQMIPQIGLMEDVNAQHPQFGHVTDDVNLSPNWNL